MEEPGRGVFRSAEYDKTPSEWAWSEFMAALRHAYLLARGERMNELRGKRVAKFDSRGLHPYSEAWGRISACLSLPGVTERVRAEIEGEEIVLSPHQMRKVAHENAYREFVTLLREIEESELPDPTPETVEWSRKLPMEGEPDG